MENNYMDPNYVPNYARKTEEMSVGSWIGTLILSAIPVVGFICLIVWAVSSSQEKLARKNWAIAQLILVIVVTVLSVILGIVITTSVASSMMY